jgi:hypothetical protein
MDLEVLDPLDGGCQTVDGLELQILKDVNLQCGRAARR